jgi:hypothetical protein
MRADDIAILDQCELYDLETTLTLHTRQRVRLTKYTAFSWSVSRHSTFQYCRRQYYLNYYGARRVREASDRIVSAVWWLKQVTTLRTWIGSVIHQAAKNAVKALRDGDAMPAEAIASMALRLYREGFQASARGRKHDDQWVVLFEHVYPGQMSVDLNAAEAMISDLAWTFAESEAYQVLCEVQPSHILEIDEPFQSFTMHGVPRLGAVEIFAIPDVLLHDGKTIAIIDWKTGDVTREGIRHQAGVYRLYAHHAYRLPEEAIRIQIADLSAQGKSVEPPDGTPSVAESEAFVRGSIQMMVDLMEDPGYNTVSLNDFPMTEDRARCQWCGFKRACWRHEETDG